MSGKKLHLGILGSTRGTDMEGIVEAIKNGKLNAEIVIVISDRKDAYILERAKSHGIPAIFINPKGFKKREDFDRRAIKELGKLKVDLILLIGYMRILSGVFVRKYKNRIMNIHPSLLPAFCGRMDMDVHKSVLNEGVKITGCTLHFVDESVDTGPIILQEPVKVEESDTSQSLKKKVQEAEKKIIVDGIRLFGGGLLRVEGKRVRIQSESVVEEKESLK